MLEKYWILPEVRDLDTATVLCAQTLTSYKNQKLGSRYEFGERPCVVGQLPSANSQVQRIERDERMGSKQSKPAATKGASFPTGKPILVYWNLCGRGDIVQCLFHAANVEYDLDSENANSWPAYKEQCPFGQLPVLKHGDGLVLAQGGAINRYAARLGCLYPTDPVEASRCDMIIEEVMDVFSCLFKPKYAADKETKLAEWAKIKDEHLPKHLSYLEKILVTSGKPFFGGDNANAADVYFFAVYGVFDHANCGADEVLKQYPKLTACLEGTKKLGKLAEFKRAAHYFNADPESGAF